MVANLSIAKQVSFQNNQKANQKHNDGNPVDSMHGPDIETRWPCRILLSEEIAKYLVQLKELLKTAGFS